MNANSEEVKPVRDISGCTLAIAHLRENPPGDLVEDFLAARHEILVRHGFSGWVEYQDAIGALELPYVSDGEYEATYGKLPRGNGSWAFYPGVNAESYDHSRIFRFRGHYSAARSAAREHFRGIRVIHVCP